MKRESKKSSISSSKEQVEFDGSPDNNTNEPMVPYLSAFATSTSRTVAIMGMNGKKDFAAITNENDFIGLIRAGIPKQVMDRLMSVADISLTEMAAIIHTSDRTLRRYTAGQRLSQEQSERMVEIARLYSRGEEVFGTLGEFRTWMDATLLAFGNKKPKEFMDTSIGISMIMDEIGRVQHGVFA